MKLRIVLCHRCDAIGGEQRQLFLCDEANRRGVDGSIYTISNSGNNVIDQPDGSISQVHYFPPDDVAASPHDTRSRALISALCRDQPDVVMIKGIDYAVAREIFEAGLPSKLGVIIGGTYSHELLSRADLVYFEQARQIQQYDGQAVSAILPKYVDWNIIDTLPPVPAKMYDIINVGNFDEERKAQEMLLPFTQRWRVAFVGDGERLNAIKELCKNKPNVHFLGYVESPSVISLVSQSRIMVHPSMWEGYPRVAAEAFSVGVPVVGLRGVLDGITDLPFLITAQLEELYPIAARLLEDESQVIDLGNQARSFMGSFATFDKLSEAFFGPLDDLVSK